MKMRWIILLVSMLLSASYVAAQEFKDISADELKKMIDDKQSMALVDARSEIDYKQGHIPSAVNISPGKFQVIQQLLPENKDILLVFYCMSGKSG